MIEDYDFGKIKIDGKEYNYDVIIYPAPFDKKGGRVYPDRVDSWWRAESHWVGIEDIKKIVEEQPKTVIFGTGYSGVMKVSSETKEYLEKLDIEVIVKSTKKACDIFNKLSEKQRVIAALHLTC